MNADEKIETLRILNGFLSNYFDDHISAVSEMHKLNLLYSIDKVLVGRVKVNHKLLKIDVRELIGRGYAIDPDHSFIAYNSDGHKVWSICNSCGSCARPGTTTTYTSGRPKCPTMNLCPSCSVKVEMLRMQEDASLTESEKISCIEMARANIEADRPVKRSFLSKLMHPDGGRRTIDPEKSGNG